MYILVIPTTWVAEAGGLFKPEARPDKAIETLSQKQK
jgi:hypothetical protein